MKLRKRIPDWLKIHEYQRELSLGDLSYEIWVRAHYMRRESQSGKPIFLTFSKSEPRGQKICNLFSDALPVSVEDYQVFLEDRSYFRPYFDEQIGKWQASEGGPALQVYQAESNSIMSFLSVMPDAVPLFPLQCAVSNFFDEEKPCRPNLECGDKEIIKEFLGYLKRLRQQEAELVLLAKGIANVSGILNDDEIWNGGKLLALFDLLYWKHAFSGLTDASIGSAIWIDDPDGIRVDQRIARVGIPLIEKVFSIQVAKLLHMEYVSHKARIE